MDKSYQIKFEVIFLAVGFHQCQQKVKVNSWKFWKKLFFSWEIFHLRRSFKKIKNQIFPNIFPFKKKYLQKIKSFSKNKKKKGWRIKKRPNTENFFIQKSLKNEEAENKFKAGRILDSSEWKKVLKVVQRNKFWRKERTWSNYNPKSTAYTQVEDSSWIDRKLLENKRKRHLAKNFFNFELDADG